MVDRDSNVVSKYLNVSKSCTLVQAPVVVLTFAPIIPQTDSPGAAATSLAAGVLPLPLLPLPGLLPGLPGLPGALPGATLPPGLPAGLPATLPGALPGATLPGLPAALSAALPAGLPLPMPGLLPGLAAGTLPPELPPQPAPVVKTPPAPVQTPTQARKGEEWQLYLLLFWG